MSCRSNSSNNVRMKENTKLITTLLQMFGRSDWSSDGVHIKENTKITNKGSYNPQI
jgi:hypothetical protein